VASQLFIKVDSLAYIHVSNNKRQREREREGERNMRIKKRTLLLI